MRICFYSPYIPDHLGGGEKHLFDVAVSASRFNQVYIAIPENKVSTTQTLEDVKNKYKIFFNYDFKNIYFITTPLGTASSFISKTMWTAKFDALYYVTDGSLFFSLAKYNFLHIQIPFTIPKNGIIERIKLKIWKYKNTNSIFTKEVIEKKWNTKVDCVIYPMVNIEEFAHKTAKEKIILNVGRFFKQLHSKRQDVLIKMFNELLELHPNLMTGWQLILVGSIEDTEYVTKLQKAKGSLPITFLHDVTREKLVELYKKSSIYWHATGYEIDEDIHPEKVEHFGISTIEAMAAGAVPVVHFKGGQKEILGDDLRELGWLNMAEGILKTSQIITNSTQTKTFAMKVERRANIFSKMHFDKRIKELFTV